MTLYRLANGQETTIDDEQRLVWYGVGGYCSWWTDDWSKLKTTLVDKLPCCPKCGGIGKTITIRGWIDGAAKIESDNAVQAPHYLKFLYHIKETCLAHHRLSLRQHYRTWVLQESHKQRIKLPGEENAFDQP